MLLRREHEKLDNIYSGIRDMDKLPDAMFIIDQGKERLAIHEARLLGIPVIGVLDTNCDPDDIDFPIPGNDDAIRAIKLLSSVITDAVLEGRAGIDSLDETGEGPEAEASAPVGEEQAEEDTPKEEA